MFRQIVWWVLQQHVQKTHSRLAALYQTGGRLRWWMRYWNKVHIELYFVFWFILIFCLEVKSKHGGSISRYSILCILLSNTSLIAPTSCNSGSLLDQPQHRKLYQNRTWGLPMGFTSSRPNHDLKNNIYCHNVT
jgi:hypothetical protein